MGHRALIALIGACTLAAQDQDPADVLIRTRDKILAAAQRTLQYQCTATIERKYYSRTNPPGATSCDQIEGERARGRVKLTLGRIDRIRLEVSAPGDAELFSWTGVAPRSIKLTDITDSGLISTGSMGTYLDDIFRNPSARFQFLRRTGSAIEYAYQVALETSRSFVRGGALWEPAAYEGTFTIDEERLELRELAIRAPALAPESHGCAWETSLGYSARAYQDPRLFLPDHNTVRFVQLDGKESENQISFSECKTYPGSQQPERLKLADPLPPGTVFPLALDAPLDLSTAAAGDRITATVSKTATSRAAMIPKGAQVEGRILRFQQDLHAHHFVVAVAFEKIRIGDLYRPLCAKLDLALTAKIEHVLSSPDFPKLSWPAGTLVFPEAMTVPAGYETYWITVQQPEAPSRMNR
jgi:hypothetical protein